jgi:hypothetical protein
MIKKPQMPVIQAHKVTVVVAAVALVAAVVAAFAAHTQ